MNSKLRKPTKEELLNYERQIDLKWKLKDVLEYCTLPQLIEIKKIMEDKYVKQIYADSLIDMIFSHELKKEFNYGNASEH